MSRTSQALASALSGLPGALGELSRDELWTSLTSWRTAFASEVLESTGNQVYKGYEWHAFSHGFSQAISGENALEEYRTRIEAEFIILSGRSKDPFGYRFTGSLPDFSLRRWDLIVTTSALHWSMAFTHEPHCGPYFQQRNLP